MYRATTHGIQVDVTPEFMADRSDPAANRFFWAYTVEIANLGEVTAQLTDRHWRITDALGRVEEVRGPGVVGEQPVLKPGESFRYTSGCPLTTPSGFMIGTYRMVDDKGRIFEVDIPAFSLDSPSTKRILN
jgi:ApaG protein